MAEGFYGEKKRTLCAAYTQESPLSLFWIMLAITDITMFCKILETTYDWH